MEYRQILFREWLSCSHSCCNEDVNRCCAQSTALHNTETDPAWILSVPLPPMNDLLCSCPPCCSNFPVFSHFNLHDDAWYDWLKKKIKKGSWLDMLIEHDEHTNIKYNTRNTWCDHSRTTCGIAWSNNHSDL